MILTLGSQPKLGQGKEEMGQKQTEEIKRPFKMKK